MTGTTIGTCSLCGGRVSLPMHSVDQTPRCERCGAVPKTPHGPVIEMDRPKRNEQMGLSENPIVLRKREGA